MILFGPEVKLLGSTTSLKWTSCKITHERFSTLHLTWPKLMPPAKGFPPDRSPKIVLDCKSKQLILKKKKTGNLRPEKLLGVNISTEATLTSHATHWVSWEGNSPTSVKCENQTSGRPICVVLLSLILVSENFISFRHLLKLLGSVRIILVGVGVIFLS